MSVALTLATLAIFDGSLTGFRAAAGRNGMLEKRDYYVRAIARAGGWTTFLVAAHAALAALLCFSADDPSAAWTTLVEAARPMVYVYGSFATLTLAAFVFYFAPLGDFRVMTNVLVFGPLTFARPWIIGSGALYAAIGSRDPRVATLAFSAGISMLLLQPLLGRRYASQWRELLQTGAERARPDR